MIENDKWVNVNDIADYLSVSIDTIRSWIKQDKIPCYKLGKMYKFKLSEIDDWVRSSSEEDKNGQEN
jgi:excisionase family DNA binding protein